MAIAWCLGHISLPANEWCAWSGAPIMARNWGRSLLGWPSALDKNSPVATFDTPGAWNPLYGVLPRSPCLSSARRWPVQAISIIFVYLSHYYCIKLNQLFDQCAGSICQVCSFIISEGLSGMPAICPCFTARSSIHSLYLFPRSCFKASCPIAASVS